MFWSLIEKGYTIPCKRSLSLRQLFVALFPVVCWFCREDSIESGFAD